MKGRKRHILVDTEGLLMKVVVHSAGMQDRDGAKLVLEGFRWRWPRLRKIWADNGYRGHKFMKWFNEERRLTLVDFEVVLRTPDMMGFVPLPRRWVVERTFGWLGRYRRLAKDYEFWPESSEAMIYLAMVRTMLHRLTRKSNPVRNSRHVVT